MPSVNTIPFKLPGFEIDQVTECRDLLVIQAHSAILEATCPDCAQLSNRVHSYYTHSPRDLPSRGRHVRLVVGVRRFRCHNTRCKRQTFAERIPHLVPVHSQCTQRLTTVLHSIAIELSAEAGARVTQHLNMAMSGDTLLRMLRQTCLEDPHPEPRVIGVDDWALRKGRVYGTIVVDLERQQVIDLWPGRDANSLAAWLKQHPTIEIISRDRAGAYAGGARKGAPQAIQVANRWHLLKNLWDAVANSYDAHQRLLRQLSREPPPISRPSMPAEPPPGAPARKPRSLSPAEQARANGERFGKASSMRYISCGTKA